MHNGDLIDLLDQDLFLKKKNINVITKNELYKKLFIKQNIFKRQ